jgi:hypothetical protein
MSTDQRTHRVFIHKNEASSESKVLLISDEISFLSLKKLAAEKLGMKKVKKVFLANGLEVVSIDDIQQNENLYFSSGEAFFRIGNPSLSSTSSSSIGSSSLAAADKMNVSILGGGGVGKSAITLRFVRDFFIKNWEATIEDAYRKTVRVDEEVSVLEILDTAGQEDFSTLRAQWMMDKDGSVNTLSVFSPTLSLSLSHLPSLNLGSYIFVYSLVDKGSLDQLYSFIDLLEQVTPALPSLQPSCPDSPLSLSLTDLCWQTTDPSRDLSWEQEGSDRQRSGCQSCLPRGHREAAPDLQGRDLSSPSLLLFSIEHHLVGLAL